MNADQVMQRLYDLADPEKIQGMADYGLVGENRLGVAVPHLRKLAKEIGKDHHLALELWRKNVPEARIVATMIADPEQVTREQLEEWVSNFNAWDICDQACNNLFEYVPEAIASIPTWVEREEEFVRRTPFALIACLAWHDKKANDAFFLDYFPLIKRAADDERNYVKKAVNWALRNIGKRNPSLNKAALQLAEELKQMDSRSARWIAADAIRELRSEKIQQRILEKPLPKKEPR